MEYTVVNATIKFTKPILGSAPITPIYLKYLRSKLEKEIAKLEKKLEKKPDPVLEEKLILMKEELEKIPVTLSHDENKGLTTFYRIAEQPDHPICLRAHQILGFLKSVANDFKDMLGIKNARNKVATYVAIRPIDIPLYRDEELKEQIIEPDRIYERPLRAMTMQGERTSIARSEVVNPPAYANFNIIILPNKEIKIETIKTLLKFGQFRGIGQWSKSGEVGLFEVIKFEEVK